MAIVAALGVLSFGVVHFGKPEIDRLMRVAGARGSSSEIRAKNVEPAHPVASPLAREREPAAASDQRTPSLPVSEPPARDLRATGNAIKPVRVGKPRALATPNSLRAGAQSRAVPARPKRKAPGAPGAASDSSSAELPAQPSAARAVAPEQRDPLSRRK